ncbi:MAG: AmmeMemoRadiSam system protein B [Candidatus Methylomirabilales bacterium]
MVYPKLRSVEAFPTQVNGRQVVCLRDPTHYAEAVLFIPLAAVDILRHFDGNHSVLDIQAEYVRRRGELLFREQVEDLIAMLDQHYFLESDRFANYQEALDEGFRQGATRPAFLAGKSYPSEPVELRHTLDQMLRHPEGPDGAADPVEDSVRALIAPHIDFMRGQVGYAWSYRGLEARTDADLFVILGTAHAGTTRPFAACTKDFETPLGPVRTDRDMLHELKQRCPTLLAVDDTAHRAEHSIEFQVIFLQHLLGATRSIRILPILCGSFHDWVLNGTPPSDDPEVQSFLETLRALLEARGSPVCLIAGADLTHVGARFGDPDPITPDFLQWIEAQDRHMLEPVAAGDPDGFFRFVSREDDRRRICGLPPIYTLLHVMKSRPGRLLHYGQAADPQGVVSFCSMAFPA